MRNYKSSFDRTGEISREPNQRTGWLDDFAEKLALQENTERVKTASRQSTAVEVSRNRYNTPQPSVYELMSTIISAQKPKFSSVDEAVKHYQESTGLAQYINAQKEDGMSTLATIISQAEGSGRIFRESLEEAIKLMKSEYSSHIFLIIDISANGFEVVFKDDDGSEIVSYMEDVENGIPLKEMFDIIKSVVPGKIEKNIENNNHDIHIKVKIYNDNDIDLTEEDDEAAYDRDAGMLALRQMMKERKERMEARQGEKGSSYVEDEWDVPDLSQKDDDAVERAVERELRSYERDPFKDEDKVDDMAVNASLDDAIDWRQTEGLGPVEYIRSLKEDLRNGNIEEAAMGLGGMPSNFAISHSKGDELIEKVMRLLSKEFPEEIAQVRKLMTKHASLDDVFRAFYARGSKKKV